MNKRAATLMMVLSTLMTTLAFGDEWSPHKPSAESPEVWLNQIAGFFTDMWKFLAY